MEKFTISDNLPNRIFFLIFTDAHVRKFSPLIKSFPENKIRILLHSHELRKKALDSAFKTEGLSQIQKISMNEFFNCFLKTESKSLFISPLMIAGPVFENLSGYKDFLKQKLHPNLLFVFSESPAFPIRHKTRMNAKCDVILSSSLIEDQNYKRITSIPSFFIGEPFLDFPWRINEHIVSEKRILGIFPSVDQFRKSSSLKSLLEISNYLKTLSPDSIKEIFIKEHSSTVDDSFCKELFSQKNPELFSKMLWIDKRESLSLILDHHVDEALIHSSLSTYLFLRKNGIFSKIFFDENDPDGVFLAKIPLEKKDWEQKEFGLDGKTKERFKNVVSSFYPSKRTIL